LIVVMLFGSTAWPDVCARRAGCCRNGACPMMQASSCHHHEEAKSAVLHYERATTIAAPMMPLPNARAAVRVASLDARPLAGIDRIPDRPPRLDSPSR